MISLKFLFFILDKIRNQTTTLIQDSDTHLRKCIEFLSSLIEIQKDSKRTSKEKLEQLKVNHIQNLTSLTLTIENNLVSARDLSNILPNEPQIRHQIEQLNETRNKIKEQFDVNIISSFFCLNIYFFKVYISTI
jgi:hypothetical protein